MLTEAEYARQEQALGASLHLNQGVWWRRVFPFYTKPAFEFRQVAPGSARPAWHRSFAGYSHQVATAAESNRSLEYMILEGEPLETFGMPKLDSKKRNQVRKGLKSCRIGLIDDLSKHREAMLQINITQSLRQMKSGEFYVPVTHYTKGEEAWWQRMVKHFGLPGRDWWGAFLEDRLIAYIFTEAVDSVLFVRAVKTHTDFFNLCPSDALHFTVLENAAKSGQIKRVIHGGADGTATLNRYKEQFLFTLKPTYWYSANETLYRAAVRMYGLKEKVRMFCQSQSSRWLGHLGSARSRAEQPAAGAPPAKPTETPPTAPAAGDPPAGTA